MGNWHSEAILLEYEFENIKMDGGMDLIFMDLRDWKAIKVENIKDVSKNAI